jgi:hypothetical protein
MTESSGVWSKTGFQMGTTYRVTPSRAGYTFAPQYTDFSGESSGLNFIGASVVPPGIKLVSPNGGEILKVGTPYNVTWTYTGNPGSRVKIELLKNGILNRTITSRASIGSGGTGSYNWKISRTQATGTDYKIKIASTTNSSATDTSNVNFSISP